MRKLLGKTAVLILALIISASVLNMGTYAWDKEQQALNNVLDKDDTVCAPIEVELPEIYKEVDGKEAPEESFTFALTGNDNAPMPTGSSDGYYTVSRSGEGTVSLGSITFDEPGEYTYTVSEIKGNELGWTYDDTEYTIIVTVKKDGDGIIADYTIRKNNENVSKILFINIYEKIDLNEEITISGQKAWVHGTNPEEKRPDRIVVMIYADGIMIEQKTVTAKSNWIYTFTLPKYYSNGEMITYTIDEATVKDYSKEIRGYNIINTYVGENTPAQPDDPTTPDNPPTDNKPGTPPKTGDEFPLKLWVIMMTAAIIGFILMIWLLIKNPAYHGKHLKKKKKRM